MMKAAKNKEMKYSQFAWRLTTLTKNKQHSNEGAVESVISRGVIYYHHLYWGVVQMLTPKTENNNDTPNHQTITRGTIKYNHRTVNVGLTIVRYWCGSGSCYIVFFSFSMHRFVFFSFPLHCFPFVLFIFVALLCSSKRVFQRAS